MVVRARAYKRGIKIFDRYIEVLRSCVCVCTYYYSKKKKIIYIYIYKNITAKTEVVANFSII